MRMCQSVGLVVAGLLCLVGGEAVRAAGSESKVKINVTAEKPAADGKQTIIIDLDIEKDWHAYANPVGNDMLATAATKVILDSKLTDVKIDYPKGKTVIDPVLGNYDIYEGKVQIKATVKRGKDDGPLQVKVKFGVCNDQGMCLLPSIVEKKVD